MAVALHVPLTSLLRVAMALVALPAAADAQGQIMGRVVGERGEPLVNAIVTLMDTRKAIFTDEDGRFHFAPPLPGSARLHVRRLGYRPVALVVAPSADTLRFRLERVAVRLDAITVREAPRCTRPGAPRPERDRALADAYEQLRLNALQYNVLTRDYPFRYLMFSERGSVKGEDDREVRITDTLVIDAGLRWHYRPGNVLTLRVDGDQPREVVMNLPTIDVFANDVFVANHCFFNGGVEVLDGMPYMRIDFRPASRLRTRDLEGSILLDTATFQVRRSVVRLSGRPSRAVPSVEAVADFAEAFPSVGVLRRVQSLQRPLRTSREMTDTLFFEDQFLLRLMFSGTTPTRRPRP